MGVVLSRTAPPKKQARRFCASLRIYDWRSVILPLGISAREMLINIESVFCWSHDASGARLLASFFDWFWRLNGGFVS